MSGHYPAKFDVTPPIRYERAQVALRIVLALLLGMIGAPLGWLFGLVYLALPVLAAVFIGQRGPARYLAEIGPSVTRALRWLITFHAYMAFLTDRLLPPRPEELARLEVATEGTPTVSSALLRVIYSLPAALALLLLGLAGTFVWLVAAILILWRERYPVALYEFLRGMVRWQARLLAYHASLTYRYPPFALDTGPEPAAAAP